MTRTRTLRPKAQGRFLLVCEHASNHVPSEFRRLGLPKAALRRHIAWDIGAASVTECLSRQLNSPAVLCGISRLVIDCNRQPTSPDLIPTVIDGTPIPGNSTVSPDARKTRIERWFDPYHEEIEHILQQRLARGRETVFVAVHSMTPNLGGQDRPWAIALSSHTNRQLSDPVLAALRGQGDLLVGDNTPYRIDPLIDYSVPFHAIRRGLPHLQVEFRQDLIASAASQRRWALRFAKALNECT